MSAGEFTETAFNYENDFIQLLDGGESGYDGEIGSIFEEMFTGDVELDEALKNKRPKLDPEFSENFNTFKSLFIYDPSTENYKVPLQKSINSRISEEIDIPSSTVTQVRNINYLKYEIKIRVKLGVLVISGGPNDGEEVYYVAKYNDTISSEYKGVLIEDSEVYKSIREELFKFNGDTGYSAILSGQTLYGHLDSSIFYLTNRRRSILKQIQEYYTVEELNALPYRKSFYENREKLDRVDTILGYYASWKELLSRLEGKASAGYGVSALASLGISDDEIGDYTDEELEDLIDDNSTIKAYMDEYDDFDMRKFIENRGSNINLNVFKRFRLIMDTELKKLKQSRKKLKKLMNAERQTIKSILNGRKIKLPLTLEQFDFKYNRTGSSIRSLRYTIKSHPYDYFSSDAQQLLSTRFETPSDNIDVISRDSFLFLTEIFLKIKQDFIPPILKDRMDTYNYLPDLMSVYVDLGYEMCSAMDKRIARGTEIANTELFILNAIYNDPSKYDGKYYLYRNDLIKGACPKIGLLSTDNEDIFDVSSLMTPPSLKNTYHHYRPVATATPGGTLDPIYAYNKSLTEGAKYEELFPKLPIPSPDAGGSMPKVYYDGLDSFELDNRWIKATSLFLLETDNGVEVNYSYIPDSIAFNTAHDITIGEGQYTFAVAIDRGVDSSNSLLVPSTFSFVDWYIVGKDTIIDPYPAFLSYSNENQNLIVNSATPVDIKI